MSSLQQQQQEEMGSLELVRERLLGFYVPRAGKVVHRVGINIMTHHLLLFCGAGSNISKQGVLI